MSDRDPAAKQSDHLRFLLTLILAVGGLYAGRSVILPLALSVLLAFILTPLVIAVQKRGIHRVPAVIVVLIGTLIVLGSVGYGVETQLSKLADQLPDYVKSANIKIDDLRNSVRALFPKHWQPFNASVRRRTTRIHPRQIIPRLSSWLSLNLQRWIGYPPSRLRWVNPPPMQP